MITLTPDEIYAIYAAGLSDGQESDESTAPQTPAVAALIAGLRARYRADNPRRITPPAGPVPDWLLAEIGDDPQLLADKRVDWLLSQPRSETYPQPDLWFLNRTPTSAD